MDRPISVLFIAGWGRSGSTILENILGQHPDMQPVGEIKFIWDRGLKQGRPCGCGTPIPDCPFWSAVFERAFGGVAQIDVDRWIRASESFRSRHLPVMLMPAARDWYRRDLWEYRHATARLYRAIHEVSGAKWIIDSSKYPPHAFLLQQIREIELKVLHVTRDPRAVAFSWQRRKVDLETPDGDEMPRMSPALTGVYWSGWNEATRRLTASAHTPRKLVRYEDFAEAPRRTTDELIEWIGVEGNASPFRSERIVHLAASHTVSGNPIRFDVGEVSINVDSRWLSAMTRGSQLTAQVFSWPVRRRFGY